MFNWHKYRFQEHSILFMMKTMCRSRAISSLLVVQSCLRAAWHNAAGYFLTSIVISHCWFSQKKFMFQENVAQRK